MKEKIYVGVIVKVNDEVLLCKRSRRLPYQESGRFQQEVLKKRKQQKKLQ
jgi:hypothetical protein